MPTVYAPSCFIVSALLNIVIPIQLINQLQVCALPQGLNRPALNHLEIEITISGCFFFFFMRHFCPEGMQTGLKHSQRRIQTDFNCCNRTVFISQQHAVKLIRTLSYQPTFSVKLRNVGKAQPTLKHITTGPLLCRCINGQANSN